jgi:hypothetical protein
MSESVFKQNVDFQKLLLACIFEKPRHLQVISKVLDTAGTPNFATAHR